MRTWRVSFILLAVILTGVAVQGCLAPTQPVAVSGQAATAGLTTPSGASGTVIVTDALGRTVTFAQPPQRIVLAGKAFFMIVDALYLFPEAAGRVVGLPDTTQSKTDFYPLIDPDRTNKTFFQGNDVGPEQIVPTRPDVVVTKSVNAGKLGKALEQVNIPVVYVDLETPEQYTRDIAILGQVLGDPERARQVSAYYKEQVDRVTSRIRNLPEGDRPRVLLLQHAEKTGTVAFSVPPAEWMQTLIVELAGGQAIWKQSADKSGWTVVGLEQIAAWNPDAIFVVNYGGDSRDVVVRLRSDPMWHSLRAVQNARIYAIPADFYSWDQPDARWGLGLTWLATKIHPELFGEVNILREVEQFYAMYGWDRMAVQSRVIPLLQGDLP